jgi:oligopeptidase A
MESANPLLQIKGLPLFEEIEPVHVEPALDYMLENNRMQIDRLVAQKVQPTWENFMEPLEELNDNLEKMWSPVSHLNGVKDSEDLRRAYEACLPKLTDYASELGQNRGLFEKFSQLRQNNAFDAFEDARKQSIIHELRDFRLSGIDLDGSSQVRYREISTQLSELTNQFSQNVLDATDAWTIHVDDSAQLEGIPDMAVNAAHKKAEQAGSSGWVFGLQAPEYIPVMTYCNNRDIRQKMYTAYVTRASETGPDGGKWDNSDIICQILELRKELANLLGFDNYAQYSLETKMASGPDEVAGFLEDLATRSRKSALQEVAELRAFARAELGIDKLEPWDYAWVSEKLKISRYSISDEELRPYFPLPKVLEGMFAVVEQLFGITVTETEVEQKWDSSVQFFEVKGECGELRGYFYTDLFARRHKRGGAWMADCVSRRSTTDGIQLPVAFLTCNFSAPVGDKPSLLSHDEVITLFHEFGHGLHHMLTRIDVALVSGINGVPWDAVELPSQFLENWCWEKQALEHISGHYQTGDSIPDAMLERMKAARNFQSAMQMLRQIEFSLFDLEIHRMSETCESPRIVRDLLARVRNQVSVVDTPEFNRFENGFGHIFAGGYAAGYYSYKWAEVLSADAFARFEEEGIFSHQAGRSFLSCILEKGGSREPMDLFVEFRGRPPQVDALLRHSGLD